MGFLVSLLSDRLLHLISFCRPLLRGGVLVLGLVLCWAGAITHLLICSIALIKLNRCLSSGRQGAITELFIQIYVHGIRMHSYVLKVLSVSLI